MKRDFKILEGGKKHLKCNQKIFNSAFITNTRLMGALGLYILWDFENSNEDEFFLKYFYFETDKNGLEAYEESINDSKIAMKILENTIPTLGGNKISISYKEAVFLIQKYHNIRISNGIKPCTNIKNYQSILNEDVYLSSEEISHLNNKILDDINTTNELCHYAMLRIFENDLEGLGFLWKHNLNLEFYKELFDSNLCKNSIKQDSDDIFLCETLVEKANKYYIVKSKLIINDLKIVLIKHMETLKITSIEAAMIMSKPEFISHYFIDETCQFNDYKDFTIKMPLMDYPHDSGHLFMVFKENNNYMKNSVYHVHDDIIGSYFVTNLGEMIISSSRTSGNINIESQLLNSKVGKYIMLSKRYHFDGSVLLDFIKSGFENFHEYISIISQDDPN